MPIAILDPFSGISGDMTLGALVAVGLDAGWLRELPSRLGLDGVGVRVATVQRCGIACTKVDFDIPPQPHGRHLSQLRSIVEASTAPPEVKEQANSAFTALAAAEGEIHGVSPEAVHLHEVGAVDAILDVVGAIWGLRILGIRRVYCGAIALGDGTVEAAHGTLPVPAPATLKLLEGHRVRSGPAGAGELVTPTGAALIRVLSAGPPPAEYIPLRSGFGAGTKEFPTRPNALRIALAEEAGWEAERLEQLVLLTTDIDDMPGEYLSGLVEALRGAGALDVILLPTWMKKGRPGTRVEVLARLADVGSLEHTLFTESTTIGIRRLRVDRRALPRETRDVEVFGHSLAVKLVRLPDGSTRVKPEYEDVRRLARETGRPIREVLRQAMAAAERLRDDPGNNTRQDLVTEP